MLIYSIFESAPIYLVGTFKRRKHCTLYE